MALLALSHHGQAKTIESAERGQIRAAEPSRRGGLRHVEVFRTKRVETLIGEEPRNSAPPSKPALSVENRERSVPTKG